MTVRVAPNAAEQIRRKPNRVVVQVQHASDADLAAQALERARPEIDELATKGTSEVERIPSGPFLVVNDRANLNESLFQVPEVVARHLEEMGVEAVVACIPHGGAFTAALAGFAPVRRVVVCRLFPPPPELREDPPLDIPDAWLRDAEVWLTEGLPDNFSLWAEVNLVEFSLPAGEALRFLQLQRRHRRRAVLLSGKPRPPDAPALPPGLLTEEQRQLGDRIRGVGLGGVFQPHLVLAGGGVESRDDELVALAEQFKGIVRRFGGELGYAFVDIRPALSPFSYEVTGWGRVGGVPAEHLEPFCDEVVFDAYPYQVLGQGHVARLGRVPEGAYPLSNGRFELSLGDLTAWLIDDPGPRSDAPFADLDRIRKDKDIQERGRDVLRPCLVTDAVRLQDERWERVKRRRLDLESIE